MALRDSLAWHKATSDSKGREKSNAHPRSRARLQPRDEAIFLLHCAAEVEHALLVQYLYAGYSLRSESENAAEQDALDRWRLAFFSIARQEMGHLATVQNLTLSIGGPLNFEREDFPFRSGFYPFHFRLERLTRDSLAKYLVAEMPQLSTLPLDRQRVMKYVIRRATRANRKTPVNRVGSLYDRLREIFHKLTISDFRFDTFDRYQALAVDFGFNDPPNPDEPFVCRIDSKRSAEFALDLVAEQGEGTTGNTAGSHFDTFYQIWTDAQFPETNPTFGIPSWVATHAVPTDPSIGSPRNVNNITNSLSKLVALLGNARYRNSLLLLELYMRLDARQPSSCRSDVAQWIKEEMKPVLSTIGSTLPLISRQSPDVFVGGERAMAGLPFQLPYTLSYSYDLRDHWRAARILIDQSIELCNAIHDHPDADIALKNVVQGIKNIDTRRLPKIDAMSL